MKSGDLEEIWGEKKSTGATVPDPDRGWAELQELGLGSGEVGRRRGLAPAAGGARRRRRRPEGRGGSGLGRRDGRRRRGPRLRRWRGRPAPARAGGGGGAPASHGRGQAPRAAVRDSGRGGRRRACGLRRRRRRACHVLSRDWTGRGGGRCPAGTDASGAARRKRVRVRLQFRFSGCPHINR